MFEHNFRIDDTLWRRDPGLSFRISQLVKDLKTFARTLQIKIDRLEKDSSPNKELILQERAVLETTRKEIRRLEREAIYSELGE